MVDGAGHGRSLASGPAAPALDCAAMHALILADGEPAERLALDAAWPGWDEGVELVVAADGGARQAERLGVRVDIWVGDGDSLASAGVETLRAAGSSITVTPVDKDETDTELAVGAALTAGAVRLSIVGAVGGARLDHALANVALLAAASLTGRDVRLVGPSARIRLLEAGAVRLEGRPGDLVTLLPIGGDALGVATDGLRYPLHDETLLLGRTRGVSNVRLGPVAEVRLRAGRLLVIETPARLRA